jgi:hypothetical protein
LYREEDRDRDRRSRDDDRRPGDDDSHVATTIGTEIGTGKGIEIEEETEIEKVDAPTGFLHATPLTTAVGLQHRVTLCQQQVVPQLLPARYIILSKGVPSG